MIIIKAVFYSIIVIVNISPFFSSDKMSNTTFTFCILKRALEIFPLLSIISLKHITVWSLSSL
nr:MAG TPA_asm: hypothetical protein [Caudoviricetes sp.]